MVVTSPTPRNHLYLSLLCRRSALKKILERDDVSSRTMVLCVASVSVTDSQNESVVQDQKDQDAEKDAQGNTKKVEVAELVL